MTNTYDETKRLILASHGGVSDILECLIDVHGLPHVLTVLAFVAEEKAEHIRCNWQDEPLANQWGKIAVKLAKCGNSLPKA